MSDTTRHGPLAPARRAHVLAVLARDGQVRTSRLIDELGVAPVTLRRDLVRMEHEGLLMRVHGGAVPAPADDDPAPEVGDVAPTGTIAVLVPSLSYYWPNVVRGVEAEANRRGMRILLRGASYELQDERPTLQRLVDHEGVCGLIVAPNTDTEHAQDVVQWLADRRLPTVLVERDAVVLPGHEPMESVTSDHARGAGLAARHLASLGHRRVGLVRSRFSPTSRKVVAGWHTACTELGLTSSEEVDVVLPDRSTPEFSGVVDAMLDAAVATGTTGLLVHADPEAMAVIDLALNRGISVPGDLSVIAYDDEVADHFSPALTAVSPPRSHVGAAAVDLVVGRLANPARPAHRVVVSPQLIVRDSTAPPR